MLWIMKNALGMNLPNQQLSYNLNQNMNGEHSNSNV